MKVKIDYDLCMGDRNCNKLCPEVFAYDEDQMTASVLVDEVPEHLEGLVRQAAAECVPEAIVIEEQGIKSMHPEDNLREDHGRIMKLFAAWQKILGELDHPDQAMHEALAKCITSILHTDIKNT